MPYHQLSTTARMAVTPKENESLLSLLTANQNLDRTGELDIAVGEWMTAGEAVVKLVRRYHGDARANALEAHHKTVIGLAVRTDWQAAFSYDVAEREMAAAQPEHDLGTPNQTRVNLVTTEFFARREQKASLEAMRQWAQNMGLRRPAPADHPVRDQPPPKRLRGPQGAAFGGGGARPNGRGSRCFRCGAAGHLPATCTAATTTAGRAAAALAHDARSPHALTGPDGRTFCFTFALHSNCRDDTACPYFHGCSICGATAHGAGGCGRN